MIVFFYCAGGTACSESHRLSETQSSQKGAVVSHSDGIVQANFANNFAKNDIIRIGTTNNMAGAISSLIWKGKEFINTYDHGREYQAAVVTNIGEHCGECYNPTEAGGRNDGSPNKPSSSKLLGLKAEGRIFESTSLMAFWMNPGELHASDDPRPAINKTILSDYKLSKRVEIGYAGINNAIEFLTSVEVPEDIRSIQVEAPTAYLNAEFKKIYTFDPLTGSLIQISNTYQEPAGAKAIVISTEDGKYAMGAWAQTPTDGSVLTYGSGFFDGSQKDFPTSKWTIVFRRGAAKAGTYNLRSYQFVGSRDEVTSAMKQVASKLGATGNSAQYIEKMGSMGTPAAPTTTLKTQATAAASNNGSNTPTSNPSSAPYAEGLFKLGSTVYFSNGSDAYCALTSMGHLTGCGFSGKNIADKSQLPSGMRNDGACKCTSDKLPRGTFKFGNTIYYSNGTDAFCGIATPEQLTRCGMDKMTPTTVDHLPSGMRNDSVCGC
ncbi:MAG: hypothetical protein RIR26_1346 [Pseudomonadota bacterium]|jgi:hypothetical protein